MDVISFFVILILVAVLAWPVAGACQLGAAPLKIIRGAALVIIILVCVYALLGRIPNMNVPRLDL